MTLVTDSTFDMGRRGKNVGGLGSFLMNMDNSSMASLAAKKEALLKELELVTPPPPPKKRKTTVLGAGCEIYDASALVPRYTSEDDVPEHLQKCKSSSFPGAHDPM